MKNYGFVLLVALFILLSACSSTGTSITEQSTSSSQDVCTDSLVSQKNLQTEVSEMAAKEKEHRMAYMLQKRIDSTCITCLNDNIKAKYYETLKNSKQKELEKLEETFDFCFKK